MPHPRIHAFSELTRPTRSAAKMGYHMPAEWHPHACIWVTRPHNEETWPTCLDEAQEQFDQWITAIAKVTPVSETGALGIATNDSWIRDFGPIFVIAGLPGQAPAYENTPASSVVGGVACHDFRFTGWGDKYELRELDDMVPQHIAHRLNLPIWIHDFILEAGSIDVNGQGVALTTEQCLLNQNRNPHLTRLDIERILAETLGITHLIYLPGGITGDDTDGHIDDIARFIAPNRIAAVTAPPDRPDHVMLTENLRVLENARDQRGNPFDLIKLPSPEPIFFDYPPDRFGPGGQSPVPASYANFLITNHSVFLPIFHQPTDDIAARTLETAMPGYSIIPLPADILVRGLGSFHCLSQQQPCRSLS